MAFQCPVLPTPRHLTSPTYILPYSFVAVDESKFLLRYALTPSLTLLDNQTDNKEKTNNICKENKNNDSNANDDEDDEKDENDDEVGTRYFSAVTYRGWIQKDVVLIDVSHSAALVPVSWVLPFEIIHKTCPTMDEKVTRLFETVPELSRVTFGTHRNMCAPLPRVVYFPGPYLPPIPSEFVWHVYTTPPADTQVKCRRYALFASQEDWGKCVQFVAGGTKKTEKTPQLAITNRRLLLPL